MPETISFYLLSGLTILASLFVIGQKNPMYSVVMLVTSFCGLAGLYVLLDAPFLAVVQIVVYVGAIMVLFLFVVMLLNAPREDAAEWDRSHPLRQASGGRIGAIAAAILAVELVVTLAAVMRPSGAVGSRAGDTVVSSVRELGIVLFRDHGFAFEATSLLVLVAMVGAVVLARREGES
jgi:NADH-quinone oxidoreductase subunit J